MGELKLENIQHIHQVPTPTAKEPPFLRENWKKILASVPESRPDLRFVRVMKGVATITNGSVIVRHPVDAPDGFYSLNERSELVPGEFRYWMRYPDIEAMKPFFNQMTHTPGPDNPACIKRDHVGRFMEFVGFVRDQDRLGLKKGCVVIEQSGAYSRFDNSAEFRQFPCQMPIVGDFLAFDAGQLHLALVELLRYDHVIIAYENKLTRRAPLFMGLNWDRCVLAMPTEY